MALADRPRLSVSLGVLRSGFQNGTDDSVRNLGPKQHPGHVVKSEVLSRVDPAQSRLEGRVRKTVKVAGHPGERFGCDVECDVITQLGLQYLAGGEADGAVRPRIRWIGRSLRRK